MVTSRIAEMYPPAKKTDMPIGIVNRNDTKKAKPFAPPLINTMIMVKTPSPGIPMNFRSQATIPFSNSAVFKGSSCCNWTFNWYAVPLLFLLVSKSRDKYP